MPRADQIQKRRIETRDHFLALVRQRPLLMGILNVTPDSFSDGGKYLDPLSAINHGLELEAQGADIIDIGGESTRPGSSQVHSSEELYRIKPVISRLSQKLDVPISIDTYKSRTAQAALEAGAVIVNDVWGLQKDEYMAETVAQEGAPVVVMHNRSAADPDLDIFKDLEDFFQKSLDIATTAGIPKEHIILDPGIGFGKTAEQCHEIVVNLSKLKAFSFPVLLGASRKSMIGAVINKPTDERTIATIATHTIGLMQGADILRVHDIVEHKDALMMFQAMRQYQACGKS